MTISIIILNYNTYRLTSACISSVKKWVTGTDYELILVDNASTECDPGNFEIDFPFIRLIRNPVNSGFAKGNNLGISQAKGEYILLLNSDTVLTEDSISKSIDKVKAGKDIGVLGCRMTFPDGTIQHSARRFRSISWELLDLFRFIPMLMPYESRAKKMLGKYFRHDEDMEVDWVNGAFFLFPRSIITQLPGNQLDDRFFMYAEDQLWCEQVKKLGYKIVFFAGTTIIHVNSGSTSINRQLQLRTQMMKHELAIMRERKGTGLYYFFFMLIYTAKERSRNFLKRIIFRLSGRMIR